MNGAQDEAFHRDAEHEKTCVETYTASSDHLVQVVIHSLYTIRQK